MKFQDEVEKILRKVQKMDYPFWRDVIFWIAIFVIISVVFCIISGIYELYFAFQEIFQSMR